MGRTTITRISHVYDDCNECPAFRKPDENGEIHLDRLLGNPFKVVITKEMVDKDGRFKPNDCKGYCESLRMVVKDVNHPVRKTSLGELSTYHHTADGKCMVEHVASTTTE